jgi:hypothetical protein
MSAISSSRWYPRLRAKSRNAYWFLDPQTETQGQTDEFYGSKKQAIPKYTHPGKLVRITSP